MSISLVVMAFKRSFHCIIFALACLGAWLEGMPARALGAASQTQFVEAVDFQTREIYRSSTKPAYTAWVSLFPGNQGEWYVSCEEVRSTNPPQPRCSLEQWHRTGLPDGYDKSHLQIEVVLLESKDQCATWKVISRMPCSFQHSAGSFGACKTRDGRFLRTVWTCYATDEAAKHPGEILYASSDGGKIWKKQPPLLPDHFAVYPHRMKQLRDGTIVLAVPYSEMWGKNAHLPTRICSRIAAEPAMQMSLFFSFDEGNTWQGPTDVFAGVCASETDFVELPSGDLLIFNNSIFPRPGRQIICRDGRQFVAGPFIRTEGQHVPECVALTKEGILVGCTRNGYYQWSDDEGETWNQLAGTKGCGYQPMIRQMDDGRIVCAWHRGADDAFQNANQFIGIDLFRLKVNRKTVNTRLQVERDYDPGMDRFLNSYTFRLTADRRPLAGKKMEMWYVARYQPGYEDFSHSPIAERMGRGGKLVSAVTDKQGEAHFHLAEFDNETNPHLSYQFFGRFNADRRDPEFKPAWSALCEYYAYSHGNRFGQPDQQRPKKDKQATVPCWIGPGLFSECQVERRTETAR